MDNLDSCYKVVQQSSAKGISADDIAEKLGVHRTTAYNYLNSLELMGKVYNEHGSWHARTGEEGIKPLDREIVIELPIPKDQWAETSLLEIYAKLIERENLPQSAEMLRTLLEKLKETRIIKIKGKNVDNLDLENLQSLILQAYEKGSKVRSRGLLKHLKILKGKGD